MLSKLFKRKSVPKNDGDSPNSDIDKLNYVKVFELELSNMEDTPVYTLTHQLSIGSEIGNIIIADPSVSPRHASFVLQQDVVSVIDHGSVDGTFVNGKKIPAGKYFILEESDTIMVGDLEIKLRAARAAVKASEEELPPPVESEETEVINDEPEEIPEEVPGTDSAEDKLKKQKVEYYRPPQKKAEEAIKSAPKKKAQKKKSLAVSAPQPAANALVRVISIIADLIVSYGIIIVLMPFDEFKDFLKMVPDLLSSLIPIDWNLIWTMISEDYGFVANILQDGYSFIAGLFDFVPVLIVYGTLRIISTFLFGVSLSELFLGMRATGNGIWARFGGVLRVLLGFITWPFIILDLPALISRRTFKELITVTRKANPSKFVTILGIILYVPLTVGFVMLAPLFQGFEPPEPVLISDRIDQKVKAKVPVKDPAEVPEAGTGAETATETEVVPEVQSISSKSSVMNVTFSYNPEELRLMPDFKFKGIKNKLKVASSLVFYQKDLQRPVEMEIFKTFDLKQLLGFGIRGNVFLYEKYPNLYNFVYEASDKNTPFKKASDNKTQMAFANEFIQFTKTAFSLSVDNAFDVMQVETPLIQGLVEYKASFLSLLEYKEFDDIGFVKIGNVTFMRVSFFKQKPFDLLIPLLPGEGKIFKITFDKKDNFKTAQSKLYKYNLDNADWMPGNEDLSPDSMTAPEVYDLFSTDAFKTLFESSDKAQSLYAYYFETSASIMQKADPVEIDIWKDKVSTMYKLLEEIPSPEITEGTEGVEDIKMKLLQNFRDMQDALENSNAEYFGIQSSTTI